MLTASAPTLSKRTALGFFAPPFTIVILSAPHGVLAGTNDGGARRSPVAYPRVCEYRQQRTDADPRFILPYVTGVLRAPLYALACERSVGRTQDDIRWGARRPWPADVHQFESGNIADSNTRQSAQICV